MAGEAAKIRNRQAYEAPTVTIRTDRSRRQNTEAGLTSAQRAALTKEENRIRNYRTEHAVVIDEDGNVNPNGNPMVGNGTSSRVRIDSSKIPANSVVTHNHPSTGPGLAGQVGSAFSGQDIQTAANRNLREIRAVTPGYTYSAKRPANGWGFKGSDFNREYIRLYERYIQEDGAKITTMLRRNGGITRSDADTYNARLNTVTANRVMRELSAKYGFTYTRRRSS